MLANFKTGMLLHLAILDFKVSFSQGNITAVLPVLQHREHSEVLQVTFWYFLEGNAQQILLFSSVSTTILFLIHA